MDYPMSDLAKGGGIWVNHIRGGAAVAAFSLVYLDANGQWQLTDADGVARMPCVGLATEPLSVNQKGRVLIQGFANNNNWAWTVGGPIYASPTVLGGLTQTKPVGGSDIPQLVGFAQSATQIYFDAKLSGVELSIEDYVAATGEIVEPTITSRGDGHSVLYVYTDFTPDRAVKWIRGSGDTAWYGVELL